MTQASEDGPTSPGHRWSRRRRAALAVALVLIAAPVVLWLVRKPIAGRFIDERLAAAHVPARYKIADLALGGQRLTEVVIGDPNRPDLVADWIETRTRIGLSGVELAGVRAGRLRVRGRLVDGRVSLGAIDRLLPASSGGAFALPKLDLAVADGRMRLETPYGVVGLALSGSGRLDDGFTGRLAVVGDTVASGDCSVRGVAAALRVRSARDAVLPGGGGKGTLRLAGPVRFAQARCAGVATGALRSDVTATVATGGWLDWSLAGKLRLDRVTHPMASAQAVTGTFAAQGGPKITARVDLAASDVRGSGMRAGQVALVGDVVHETGGVTIGYDGVVRVADADARGMLPTLSTVTRNAAETPVAPLVDRLVQALTQAAARFGGEAQVNAATGSTGTYAAVSHASLASASGARLALNGGRGVQWRADKGVSIDGTVGMTGGGLPQATARLAQNAGAPIRARVTMAPYETGGARLALAPVTIMGGATTRIVTRATLSGSVGDGRVDGLAVPIDLRIARGGAIVVNSACAPVTVQRLAVSGLTLNTTRLTLCPVDGAMVRVAGGRLGGGIRTGGARLVGASGGTPLTLAVAGATVQLADRGFVLDGVATRIGSPERVTRLDFARVDGALANGAVSGRFAGGAGQVANVPLLLSAAAGDWRFAGGALDLTGALTVADAQTPAPRFQPMAARGLTLRLADGVIAAGGVLHEPTTGTLVATVAITHRLTLGTGTADLAVPDLAFKEGFQPELLTRLTYGVIADVRGSVSGEGHIAWAPAGVTSTGAFRTAGTDLAAAFGPVTGIATEIRFTDLLNLQSASGQVAQVKSINPGIPVNDGTIRYQTLPGARVQVEGGEWPFAGGRLALDPTLLDFSAAAERRMTFHVAGVEADRFLQQFDFKNLDATGIFDGVLPMVFDAGGGRIEGGNLTVRAGGGTIRYVGEIGEKDVGFWGNVAFQALKSLRYRSLTLGMNGPLAGEMVTDVRFAGVNQGEGAKGNFLIRRLQRLPFVFNVRIKAPFRGLLDSAQSFYDPKRLIQRNLPALLEDQSKRDKPPQGVQPSASETVQ